ncbi:MULTISPECIES: ABC-2 family transporter protein [Geobacillus]|uniref:ABC-2 family transporter protein n=1 Tax=Geobacillus proteiniphilus TaxID=860353 RepID=A0A1Q5T682_9BACL|nr:MULTISPECIES: ABC-2 family transporter protein [Geobacillus]KDE50311.1 ABC transporter permease [Geobacillus sp. CAMR5420]OKO95746.1 putative ABC transporter, permease protein [Geobacillus proteiniphilus]OPX03411.1 ABC transporter permease [Geobacillus sp. LEMMY01]WMJ15772.1 ABC-2 family transporter protein [Geobacillus proteiniphilus]
MFYVSVFFQYMAQYMKTKLQYRADLFVEWLSDFMAQAVNLVFLLVVFGHTTLLHGWSRDEILFIYGFFLVPYAVFGAFFNLWDFNERYIVQGEMDRVLTRPLNSLFQIVLERMELESLLGAVPGLIIMLYAGSRLSLSFHWYDVFVFILLVIGGVLIYAGIFISLATISFFADARTSIMPMMYNISSYGRYPIDIYHRVIRYILTWVLPFAFVGVYPASYFLDKEEWYGYVFFTPVVGAVCFAVSVMLWNAGVRRYRGTGS